MPLTDAIDADDLTRVRYHIGDDDSDTAKQIFTDEQIYIAVNGVGSWQQGVISLIDRMIADLTRLPSYSASGLSVRQEGRLKALRMLRRNKQLEFNLAVASSGKISLEIT